MNTNKYFVYIFLILSFSNCIFYSNEVFEEIQFMTPTKFTINKDKTVYFKYKLDEQKKSIGLKFLHANLYTVNITIYSSYENKQKYISYMLGQNQFKEINVTDFNDYAYIVIEEMKNSYYYDDYLTIYDCAKKIKLEHNKVISINNFLSNNKYEFYYPSNNSNITILYNTQDFQKAKRKITIIYNGKRLADNRIGTFKNFYKLEGNNTLSVSIENFVKETIGNQEFSIIIYEVNHSKYNFNQIKQNQIEVINYIYNENQSYYFYTDISNLENYNTFNIKLNFQYFNKENIKVRTNLINLDKEITQEILEKNIPKTNNFPCSYDDESDEYYRIYLFKNAAYNKNYTYLLVLIEISQQNYYYGSKNLEISIGEQEEIFDYTNLELNKLDKKEKSTINYIPKYVKLKLDSTKNYLLYFQNDFKFISTFIKGDILTENKTINTNYLRSDNEIIVLSQLEEFTIKLFGPKKNIKFFIEKIESSNFEYKENARDNNNIFELKMKKGEVKYILGSYLYEDYAFGSEKVNYYATVDEGEFELYYKNNVNNEESSIFPSDSKYKLNFDEIFSLNTNIDLFKVVCNADGFMSIRPQFKEFNVTTIVLKENSYNKNIMTENSQVVQLSAPTNKSDDTLYFSILLLNGENSTASINENDITLLITPNVTGMFEEKTIKINETFTTTISLSKYKVDELVIRLESNHYNNILEMVEVIQNKFTSYKEIKIGEKEEVTSYNVFCPISSDKEESPSLFIILEDLKGKNVSYVIIKSPIKDINYTTSADKYENSTIKEITSSNQKIIISNPYYNQTDNIRPYKYLLLSVLSREDELKYGIIIDYVNEDATVIIIIVAIISALILIFLGIIIFNRIRRNGTNSGDIEKLNNELISK